MLLKCKLEDKGEMVEKTYTYSDLKDLQSKLTKQTILKFDAVNTFCQIWQKLQFLNFS